MAEFDEELNNVFVEDKLSQGIFVDTAVDDIERAHIKMGEVDDIALQREKEKKEIIQKIKDTRTKILKCKNVKGTNARIRKINEENSRKRAKLREELLNYQDDLDRLKMEMDGSTMNYENFVQGTPNTPQKQQPVVEPDMYSFNTPSIF